MVSPLENLAGPGKSLRSEPPDAAEIEGLIRTDVVEGLIKAAKSVADAL